MKEISEYTVATATYSTTLQSAKHQYHFEREVNSLIEAGWQPFGSVFTIHRGEELLLAQPMVRYRTPGVGVSPEISRRY